MEKLTLEEAATTFLNQCERTFPGTVLLQNRVSLVRMAREAGLEGREYTTAGVVNYALRIYRKKTPGL